MFACDCVVTEWTRIWSAVAKSTWSEEGDHWNQVIIERSAGRVIARIVSRVRVERIINLEGRMVAMYAPLGLGKDCPEAVQVSD